MSEKKVETVEKTVAPVKEKVEKVEKAPRVLSPAKVVPALINPKTFEVCTFSRKSSVNKFLETKGLKTDLEATEFTDVKNEAGEVIYIYQPQSKRFNNHSC